MNVVTDALAQIRGKMRFIAEVRFPVIPQLLDIRGNVIAAVHPQIVKTFPNWLSQPGDIVFVDRHQQPANEFLISTKRIAYIREDVGSLQEFADGASAAFKLALDSVGEWLGSLDRVGVRFIQVLKSPKDKSFADVDARVRGKLMGAPLDLPLRYTDSMLRLVHDYGAFFVGPSKQGEPWVAQAFRNPDDRVPEFGVGVDVDSYTAGVVIKKPGDVVSAVRSVMDLTLAAEEAIVERLELIDA